MSRKKKPISMSAKEIADLTQAVQFAFGNSAADRFFDDVMAGARKLRAQKEKMRKENADKRKR